MLKARGCTAGLLLWSVGFFSALVPLAHGIDKKDIVRQARQSYYSLNSEGLMGFRCEVLVDWDSTFKTLKTDAVGREQLLPILKKTQFDLLVGENGASTVSHRSDMAPANEEIAERLRRVTSGIEQILTGFMHTWSGFMMKSPVPESESEYQVQDLGEHGYRLALKQGTADVAISMTRDYAIEAMQVTTPEFEGTVRPRFSRKKNGFVLIGYDAVYKAASGSPQQVSVKVEYKDVEGFNLPSTVAATVNSVETLLTFGDYHLKKR